MLKDKLLGFFGKRRQHKGDSWQKEPSIDERTRQAQQHKLSKNLEANIKAITDACGTSYDLNMRRLTAGCGVPSVVIHFDALTDARVLQEVIGSLTLEPAKTDRRPSKGTIYNVAKEQLLQVSEIAEAENMADLFAGLAIGQTALIFDGTAAALLLETRGFQIRNVEEPQAEITIRGSREGFIENIAVNTSLIRRRLRIPNLWIEGLTIGRLSQTQVAFAYIKGLAGEKLVYEARSRLQRIEIDAIEESGQIEDFITDTPYSMFPTLYRTERPSKVVGALLEGRVAIFTDGTPFVLIAPTELSALMQAPDDYYEFWPIGALVRILRWFAFFLSLLLPAFYVAIINFHQELLPTFLLLRITSAREGVPFPVIAEILVMEVLFEVLREAGIRLPAAIGPAISIVGALILGDAAIRAGLVSPAVVIIVALTAIAGFSTPLFSLAIGARILRFVFTISAATFGLFGLQFLIFITAIYLCSLRSFGMPYLAPIAPFIWQDMKDNFLRLWWWGMHTRPKLLGQRNLRRVPPGQQPYAGKGSQKPGEED